MRREKVKARSRPLQIQTVQPAVRKRLCSPFLPALARPPCPRGLCLPTQPRAFSLAQADVSAPGHNIRLPIPFPWAGGRVTAQHLPLF